MDDQWELSKENIQPIRQGRDINSMMAGLDQNAQQHLSRQRNEFETELRSYSGPDPLCVWHRYALWVEQSYPTGGKASKLKPLLEKCFTAMNASTELIDQYRNDPRFLQLWLKYATMCKKPLEVLNVLEVKGLCTELAGFYENYASEMEASGNFKKADLIYKKGLEKAKDSTLLLAEAHKNFQARVFLASMAKKDEDSDDEDAGQRRVAFSALKVGKKNQAPAERVEGAVLGGAGKVPLASTGGTASNVSSVSRHSVYNDGQSASEQTSMGPPLTCKTSKLPAESVDDKENKMTATKWTKKPVAAAPINIPLDQISKFSNTAATIYHDENVVQPKRHFIPPSNNVLKEWKNPVEKETILPFIPEPFNPFAQPYYDKHKVYQGTEEFQFEEIRAIDYFKKEKLRKEAEESAKASESVASQQNTKGEEVDSMRATLSQQQKELEPLMVVQEPKETYQLDEPACAPQTLESNLHPEADAVRQSSKFQTKTITPSQNTGHQAKNSVPTHTDSKPTDVAPPQISASQSRNITSQQPKLSAEKQPNSFETGNIKPAAPGGGFVFSSQSASGDANSPQQVQASQEVFPHPKVTVSSTTNQPTKSCVFEDSWLVINKTANASVLCPAADLSLAPLQTLDASLLPHPAQPHSSTAYRTLPDLQLAAAPDVTGLPDLSELSIMEPIASPGELKPCPAITLTEASPEPGLLAPSPPAQPRAVKPKIIASDGYRKPECELQKFAASPTINTREAQRAMREVWSTSLDRSKRELSVLQHVLKDEDDSVLEPLPAPPGAVGLAVNQIYRDSPEPSVEPPAVLSVYRDEPSVEPPAVLSVYRDEPSVEPPAVLSVYRDEPSVEPPAVLSVYRDEPSVEPPAVLSVYRDEPSVAPKRAKAGLALRPVGLSERPAGLSERPAGLSERPAGLSERPAGLSERPTGLSMKLADSSSHKNTEIPSPDMMVQDENIPPEGYIQVPLERPRVGVLQPVPQPSPDDPPCLYDECMELDDLKPLPPPSPPAGGGLSDFTLKLPSNLADLAGDKHIASTPASWSSNLVPQAGVVGDDFTMAFMPGYKRSFRPLPVVAKRDEPEPPSARSLVGPPLAAHRPSTQGAPGSDKGLSVIMEGSTEHTSAKSGTTISSTFTTTMSTHPNGADGTSCYTTVDHTKTGYMADQSASCTDRTATSKTLTASAPAAGIKTTGTPPSPEAVNTAVSGQAANTKTATVSAPAVDIKAAREKPSTHSSATRELKNDSASSKVSGSKNVAAPEEWRNTSFDPDKVSEMLLNMSDSKPFFAGRTEDLASSSHEARTTASHGDSSPASQGENVCTLPQKVSPARVCRELPASFAALSVAGELDPFSEDLLSELLQRLHVPLCQRPGYCAIDAKMPLIKAQATVTLGGDQFHVRRVKGQGAYAKVFQASTVDPMNVTVLPGAEDDNEDETNHMILKVQKPSFPWEFYICHELRERLRIADRPTHVLDSVMRVNRGYFFTNGSVLASQYHKHGTLLNLLNGYKTKGLTVTEDIAIYFMIEVLLILEDIHSAGIIHADIKPDNFILRDVPTLDFSAASPEEMFAGCPSSLKLIDFGRSIDMRLLPEGTTFTRRVTTEGFSCCEMQDGRPWTYQTDLYGTAATAHTLLWGTYMNVCKRDGRWCLQGAHFKRYWQQKMWRNFFDTLLNVPSCSELPDLAELRRGLQTAFFEMDNPDLQLHMTQLRSIMSQL